MKKIVIMVRTLLNYADRSMQVQGAILPSPTMPGNKPGLTLLFSMKTRCKLVTNVAGI